MKKLMVLFGVVCLLVAGITLAVMIPSDQLHAAEMETISFRGTWFANAEMSAWHIGRHKGFFAQEGIDLKITEGKGSALNAKLVAAGTLKLAACDYGTMMKGVAEGLPIKGVFCYYQLSPMAIVSPADAPIKHPKELEGKRVASTAGSSVLRLFPALANATGADVSKIKMVMVEARTLVLLLLKKEVDALLIYYGNSVLELKEKGMPAHYITYYDFGVNVLSVGVIANTNFMEKNRDLVKRFVRAAQKSWAYAVDNPDEAADAFGKDYPNMPKERNRAHFRSYLALLHTPASKGKPIGWTTKEDWEKSQDQLIKGGMLDKRLPVDAYYTNEFIHDQ